MIQHTCRAEIEKENPANVFSLIESFVETCFLLMRSENHILVPSSQYVWKVVNIRTEADMAGEIVRTMTGLPKYTAYTKVLQEREGTHAVWTGKIRTLKLKKMPELPEIPKEIKYRLLALQMQRYMRERIQIEEEIRQRGRRVGELRLPRRR